MENQDRERGNNFYYPPQHLMTTKNLYLFFQDYQSVIDLFIFTIRLAHGADQAVLAASKALLKVSDDDAKKKYYQDTIDNPGVAVEKLNDFASLNSKNLTVNIVDAFLWYVSATIQSSMKKRPEIVKSRETE